MGKAFFVTGTDTDVGKTFFAASLASYLKSAGYNIGVFKPIESGCATIDGKMVPGDAMTLKRASGCELDMETICPYCLKEAVAPSVAAKNANLFVDVNLILNSFDVLRNEHDVVLVEGAGGVLAPLFDSVKVVDLMRMLAIPAINVIGSKLGAVNHALLTERTILDESLGMIGHVINNLHGVDDPAIQSNPDLIKKHARRKVLGVLPKANGPWLAPDTFKENFDLVALELE